MGKLTFGATGLSYQVNSDAAKQLGGGAPVCPRCTKRVYFNEEKKALGKSWHKLCFTCVKCKRSLDSTNVCQHDDEIFCTACHRREFGPKGYGFAGGMAGLSTESSRRDVRPVQPITTQVVPNHIQTKSVDHADPESCPRCGKKVYFAEEVKALKRKFHRLCFKCSDCNKMLEPGRCSTHERDIYCSACYSRNYGPKGYGFAGGAGSLLSSENNPYGSSRRKSSSRSYDTPINNEYQRYYPAVRKDSLNNSYSSGSQEWTEEVFTDN